MLHMLDSVDGWLDVLDTPVSIVVEAVDHASLLRDAKRRNENVFTVLRHIYDGHQVPSPLATVEDNIQRARDFLETFIDDTFFEKYAAYTNAVLEWNEYLADSQTQDEVDAFAAWAEAVATVWRDEYRTIPEYAHIRLVLCNTAVGNMIPRRFAEIAIEYDCLLGYHPYSLWDHSVRWDGDWDNLSGLFDVMEEEWGGDLKPIWLFTECGPFQAAEDGWRSKECLNGNKDLYVTAMGEWVDQVVETTAFKEERIRGFCIFQSGGRGGWKWFETDTSMLMRIRIEVVEEKWIMTETPVAPFTLYSQRDPAWANVVLGTSSEVLPLTIGGSGCVITSIAMLASMVGYETTPAEVNAAMIECDGYLNEVLVKWAHIENFMHRLHFEHYYEWADVVANIATVKQALRDHGAIIIGVDAKPDTLKWDHHFVVVFAEAASGDDFWIADPWTGQVCMLLETYGKPRWDLARAVYALAEYSVVPLQERIIIELVVPTGTEVIVRKEAV